MRLNIYQLTDKFRFILERKLPEGGKVFAIKGVLDMFMSTNEPENFNWHDAEIKSVYCENKKMIWEVDALNVLTFNSENLEGIDLRASTATVVFENYFIENIKRYGLKKY